MGQWGRIETLINLPIWKFRPAEKKLFSRWFHLVHVEKVKLKLLLAENKGVLTRNPARAWQDTVLRRAHRPSTESPPAPDRASGRPLPSRHPTDWIASLWSCRPYKPMFNIRDIKRLVFLLIFSWLSWTSTNICCCWQRTFGVEALRPVFASFTLTTSTLPSSIYSGPCIRHKLYLRFSYVPLF